MSGLPLPFCRATQAGANITPSASNAHSAYFRISKKSILLNIFICIKRGRVPPVYSFRGDYKPYFADLSSSSSIRINWLYFAMRSVRDIEPVLIWPAFVATARSAIVVSSVSPLRWEIITP